MVSGLGDATRDVTHEPGGAEGGERGQTGRRTPGINNKILFGRLDAHSEQQTEEEAVPLISARGDVQVKCRSLILRGGYARCALFFFPSSSFFFFFCLVTRQSANEITNIKVEM